MAKGFTSSSRSTTTWRTSSSSPSLRAAVPGRGHRRAGAGPSALDGLLARWPDVAGALADPKAPFAAARTEAAGLAQELSDFLDTHLAIEDHDVLLLFWRHYSVAEYEAVVEAAVKKGKKAGLQVWGGPLRRRLLRRGRESATPSSPRCRGILRLIHRMVRPLRPVGRRSARSRWSWSGSGSPRRYPSAAHVEVRPSSSSGAGPRRSLLRPARRAAGAGRGVAPRRRCWSGRRRHLRQPVRAGPVGRRPHARAGEFDVGGEALCFGRLDLAAGDTFHLGRVSVADEAGDPLVVDWRAPVAAALLPGHAAGCRWAWCGVATCCAGARRSWPSTTTCFELPSPTTPMPGTSSWSARPPCSQSLARKRTGRMSDIVATIQADQDQAVRAPLPGRPRREGGPGTGKTAVALQRAAYLLYTERVLLEEQGILVVGPEPAFCRYVSQVLPSLGEEGVALADRRRPGTRGRPGRGLVDEPEASLAIKGDGRMAGFLAAAVRTRQRMLKDVVEVPHGGLRPAAHARGAPAHVRQARLSVTQGRPRGTYWWAAVKDWQARRVASAACMSPSSRRRLAAELAASGRRGRRRPGPDSGRPRPGRRPTAEFVDALRRSPRAAAGPRSHLAAARSRPTCAGTCTGRRRCCGPRPAGGGGRGRRRAPASIEGRRAGVVGG